MLTHQEPERLLPRPRDGRVVPGRPQGRGAGRGLSLGRIARGATGLLRAGRREPRGKVAARSRFFAVFGSETSSGRASAQSSVGSTLVSTCDSLIERGGISATVASPVP